MSKALLFAISEFPGQEATIRARWSEEEDFVELCNHFLWMTDAARQNARSPLSSDYHRLSEDLRHELEDALRTHIASRELEEGGADEIS